MINRILSQGFNFGIFLSGLSGGFAQQYRFAAAEVAPEHLKEKNVSIVTKKH